VRILCASLIYVSCKVKAVVSAENRASSVRNIRRRKSIVTTNLRHPILSETDWEKIELCIMVLNFASFSEGFLEEFNKSGRLFPGSCYVHLLRK